MTHKSHLLVAPSMLASDFSRLGEQARTVEEAGADWLHVDVMDGHFVENITIGPDVVGALRTHVSIPLDVHLMITDPVRYTPAFVKAGATSITFHQEAVEDPIQAARQICKAGVKVGMAIRPGTPLDVPDALLKELDLVLLMTVEPGFGGQSFRADVLPKVSELRRRWSGRIEVDGGINEKTARQCREAGADVLVAGTFIFKSSDWKRAIESLRA